MGTKTKNGFTIIELMLFLSIGGLLAVGILAGSGMAISQQRYRDSVQSLKSLLQDQFSSTANVVNDRSGNLNCNSSGQFTEATASSQPRGTSSSCVLVGRLIQSHKADSRLGVGEGLHIYPVVAAGNIADNAGGVSDTEALNQYNLVIDSNRYEEHQLEWDSTVRLSSLSGPAARQFSILIVRSPLSGNIRTYTVAGAAISSPAAIVSDANLRNGLTICVDAADNNPVAGEKMAVRLAPNSSSQSGLETLSSKAGNGC